MNAETLQEYIDRRMCEELERRLTLDRGKVIGLLNSPQVRRVVNGPTLRAERPARLQRAVDRLRSREEGGEDLSWYKIKVDNKGTKKTAEVYIYDEIGYWGITSADFIDDLNKHAADATEILVRVNSPGGDVYDGIAIGNALRSHPARVTVQVDALAASAASFIAAMAGDEVIMGAYSEMMIHDASGLAIGNAGDMRQMADILDRISDNIAAMYAEKAGGSRAFWRDRMKDETWYSAEEAVAAGLADRSLSPEDDKDGAQAQAKAIRDTWTLEEFAYPGRKQAPAPRAVADVEPEPDPEPLVIPKIDPEWFRAMMSDAVQAADPVAPPDPDIIKAGISLAFNDAPAPDVQEPEETPPKEDRDEFAFVDASEFYNAVRKAAI